MKAFITRNELKAIRTDYKYTFQKKDGSTGYRDCNHRPDTAWQDADVLLKPLSKERLAQAADADKRKHFGWKVFPRHSITVELLESYRDANGEPRNRFVWRGTYNPFPEVGAIERRQEFWERLERQIAANDLSPEVAGRIRRQVKAEIPLLTKADLRKVEAAREQRKANNRLNDREMRRLGKV